VTAQSPDVGRSDVFLIDPVSEIKPYRKRLRRIAGMGAGILATACLLGFLLLGILQSDGVSTWLVTRLAVRFNPYPGTQLTVDRVSGSWIRSLRFEGVRLIPLEGQEQGGPEVVLDSLEVHFRLLPLLVRRLEIREAEVTGLRADLTQRPDSLWDFLAPFQKIDEPEGRDGEAGGFRLRSGPIRVRRVTARVTFAPGGPSATPDRLEVEDLALVLASLEVGEGGLAANLDTLHARFLPPGEALDRVFVEGKGTLTNGRVVIPGLTLQSDASDLSAEGTLLLPQGEEGEVEEIDFHLRATPLAFRDLSGFVRTLDPTVSAEADFRLQGRSSRVDMSGHLTLSDGGQLDLEGTFTPSTSAQVEYRLDGTFEDLRLESFIGEEAVGGVVDGRVAVELAGNDLAHLEGDLSVLVEGLQLDGRGTRPLVVSGAFLDGQAELEVEAGVDGLVAAHLSVGGRPLDPEPTLQLQGSYQGLSLEEGSLRAAWSGGKGTFELGQPLETGRLAATGKVAWREDPEAGGEKGRVPSYSLLDAEVLVHLWEAEFGGIVVDSAVARSSLEAGAFSAVVEGWEASGGRVMANLQGRPFDAEPFLILDSLAFSGIGLVSITGLPSHLNGQARARMEGLDPRTGNISGDLHLSPSLIRNTPVDSGEAVVSLSGGELQVSGQLSSAAGTLRLSGSAYPFAEPLAFQVDEGEVRKLNLGPLLEQEGLQSELNLDLALSGSGGSLQRLEALGNVVVLPSTLNQGNIQGGILALEAGGGQGTVQGRIRTEEGEVVIRTLASLAGKLDDLRAEGDVDVPDLGGFLGRPEAEVEAKGKVAVTWDAENGVAFAAELGGRIDEASIDTLALSGSLGESALHLDTLRLRSDLLRADGGGRLALPVKGENSGGRRGESDLSMTATILDLSNLPPLLGMGEMKLVAESGEAYLHVTGPAGAPSLAGSLEMGPWLVNGVSGDSARVRADYDSNGMTLEIWVQAPKERGSIDLVLRADPSPDEKQGTLEHLDVSTPETQWALATRAPFSWKDGLQLDGFALASDRGRISVDGKIDPRGTQNLALRLEEASLSGVARLLGLEDLNLLAHGQLTLTGPAASPVAEGDLRFELALPEGGSASADARFSLADGQLALDVHALDPAGGPLTLEGTLPMAFSLAPAEDTASSTISDSLLSAPPGQGFIDLTLQSQAFDISWVGALIPKGTVRGLAGLLSADARATGPFDQPVLEGRIGLKDGRVRFSSLGTRYEEINLSAEFRDQELRIDQASLTSGSGTAEIEGTIALLRLRPQELDLTARTNRFLAVNTPTLRGVLTGDLSLRGSAREPILTGDLNLEGSEMGLDDLSSGDEVQAVELTEEDYQMLEDYFGYSVEEGEAGPPGFLERFGLDLSLSFGRNVWIRRSREPHLSLEVEGSLELMKDPAEDLRVMGTVETLPERSYFRQFGRRFAVQEGELTLTGDPSEFVFRMDAQWEVPSYSNPDEAEVVVSLGVAGDAESLELTLSSEPEMDEADIVSYLATGKPQSALASSEADASSPSLGASMAMGAMANVLEGLASDAVELDVVEIRFDPVRGTVLIAGRYVSPDLYLGFRQPTTFGQDSNRTRTQNQESEFELEYRWFRWLTMNVQGGASELRLFLRARYAY